MMKKAVVAGMVCMAALSVSVPVFAHGQYHCGGQDCDRNYCFIDEDGDGICDNSRCVDADGNAVCGTYVADNSHLCEYFIDEDEDGVCDHCMEAEAARQAAAQSNQTRRSGHHGGRHHGGSHH